MRKLLIIIIFFCCNSLVSSEYIVNTGKLEIDGSIDFVKFSNKDDSIAFAEAGNKLYMLKLPEFEVMWEYEFEGEEIRSFDSFYNSDSIVVGLDSSVYIYYYNSQWTRKARKIHNISYNYTIDTPELYSTIIDTSDKFVFIRQAEFDKKMPADYFAIYAMDLDEDILYNETDYTGGVIERMFDEELFQEGNSYYFIWEYFHIKNKYIWYYDFNNRESHRYQLNNINEEEIKDIEIISKDTILLTYQLDEKNYIIKYHLSSENSLDSNNVISNSLLYENCNPIEIKCYKNDKYFHIRYCDCSKNYELYISSIMDAFSDEEKIIKIDQKFDFNNDNSKMITVSNENVLTLYDFNKTPSNIDYQVESNFKLHPNPTNDLLHIESDTSVKLSITNTSGQTVKTIRLIQSGEIDISDLIPGVYFLIDENNEMLGKFVKK